MNNASGLGITKILSGISKTLGIANQVIPLYQQTKPLFKNVRSAYGLIKAFNNTTKETKDSKTLTISNKEIDTKKTIIKSNNSPQFFI